MNQLMDSGVCEAIPILSVTNREKMHQPRSARLFGREGEIAELCGMLHDPGIRLLTITGPAGVGKSALANAVLATPVPYAADGIIKADLASTGSRTIAWRQVAAALGIGGDAAALALPELVGSEIGDRELLLVLDNCDLVAPLLSTDIAALLRGCPALRVLLTSRISLEVYAEHLFPVAPFPVGSGGQTPYSSVAVQLFIDRVRAHYRSDVLHGGELHNIAEICELLDGVPLAIEVTARAVGTLSPRALLEQLRRGAHPYNSRLLDVPTRHQSVPGALSWGDQALSAEERALLQRLAVCETSIDLPTAQRLGNLSLMQAARRLDSLVHKSLLVSAKREGGEPEFRMLTATRNYYRKRLAQDPEEQAEARNRHAEHYAKFAVAAERGLRIAEERAHWLALAQTRLADIRTAIRRLQAKGEHATAVRTLLALEEAWVVHNVLRESAGILSRSVTALEAADVRDARDAALLADALETAGRWAMAGEELQCARALLTRAAELYRGTGDPGGRARVAALQGELLRRAGDADAAERQAEFAVAELDAIGDVRNAATARRLLSLVRAGSGKPDAEAPLVRALEELRSLEEPYARAVALIHLARVRLATGRSAEAYTTVREAMEILTRYVGGPADVVLALETAARSAPSGGGTERAHVLRLLGLAKALREQHELPPSVDGAALRSLSDQLREATGDAADGDSGRTATAVDTPTLYSALATALSAPVPKPVAGPGTDARLAGLTPRQHQIAELVAEGMTNRQIARSLELSEWTVVNHLRQVMNKLECPSRVHVTRIVQQTAAG